MLTCKVHEYNYYTKLIELVGSINDSMPDFVVQRCMEILNEQGKVLKLRDANSKDIYNKELILNQKA